MTMAKQFSLTILIIPIVSTAVGTCLVSLLACYLVTRRHRAKQQAHDEEKQVNDALDRAIVSYIVKELPSPHGSRATQTLGQEEPIEGPQLPEPAMTTAVDANLQNLEPSPPQPPSPPAMTPAVLPNLDHSEPYCPQDSPQYRLSAPFQPDHPYQHATQFPFPYEPPTPTGDQCQLLQRTTSEVTELYTPRSGRRTASSHFMDSSERVYADILARPLEHVMAWSQPRVSEPVPEPEPEPAPRDDVGWPLTSRERGWV